MFKRVLSMIIVAALSVVLFTGCSSGKPENFDADQFVKECRLLVPSSQYQSAVTRDFKIDFSKTVMDKFGKSDYYNNMNEEQRFEAIEQLGEVLESFSYGPVTDGFVWDFMLDKTHHTVSWTIKYYNDTKVVWTMPGY